MNKPKKINQNDLNVKTMPLTKKKSFIYKSQDNLMDYHQNNEIKNPNKNFFKGKGMVKETQTPLRGKNSILKKSTDILE